MLVQSQSGTIIKRSVFEPDTRGRREAPAITDSNLQSHIQKTEATTAQARRWRFEAKISFGGNFLKKVVRGGDLRKGFAPRLSISQTVRAS